MMDKVTRVGLLYDIYGNLLTERQREVVELYYFDDWSLGEVAEQVQVSRQAVHDNLRRAEEVLEGYETQLQLLAAREKSQSAVAALTEAWAQARKYVAEDAAKAMDAAIRTLEQQV